MWQAAIGVIIGYAFAWRWVRRDTGRETEAVGQIYQGPLEARDREVGRDSFDKSQRALTVYERRKRYLESALATSLGPSTPQPPRSGPLAEVV